MPLVAFTNRELQALQDIYNRAERVDWEAYDQARAKIKAVPAPPARVRILVPLEQS